MVSFTVNAVFGHKQLVIAVIAVTALGFYASVDTMSAFAQQENRAIVAGNTQTIDQNQDIESENEIETGDASNDQTAQTGIGNIRDIIIEVPCVPYCNIEPRTITVLGFSINIFPIVRAGFAF